MIVLQREVGSYSLKIVASSSQGENTVPSANTFNYIQNHEYYIGMYYKISRTSAVEIFFPLEDSGGYYDNGAKIEQVYSYSQFGRVGFIREATSKWSSGNKVMRIDNNNDHKDVTLYVDDLFIVDLTNAFGAGKEPSKEWCNKYININSGTSANARILEPILN